MIDIGRMRVRTDDWLRQAERAWRDGRVRSAIAAADEARDGAAALAAALRAEVVARALAAGAHDMDAGI